MSLREMLSTETEAEIVNTASDSSEAVAPVSVVAIIFIRASEVGSLATVQAYELVFDSLVISVYEVPSSVE